MGRKDGQMDKEACASDSELLHRKVEMESRLGAHVKVISERMRGY